jgi:hypothetical protein
MTSTITTALQAAATACEAAGFGCSFREVNLQNSDIHAYHAACLYVHVPDMGQVMLVDGREGVEVPFRARYDDRKVETVLAVVNGGASAAGA